MKNWISGSGGDVVYRLYIYFLFLALVAILFGVAKPFVQFGRGYYEEHSCEIN